MSKDISAMYARDADFWDSYHKYRPEYPEELFNILFDHHTRYNGKYERAIDYGSGPGTIIPTLLSRFNTVLGTDLNSEQIQNGNASLQKEFGKERVEMKVGKAGECDWIESASADMVTAAKAIHWFDVNKWMSEAERILRPGGTLAFWVYPGHYYLPHSSQKAQEAANFMIGKLLEPAIKAGSPLLRSAGSILFYRLENVYLNPDAFTNETRHHWNVSKELVQPYNPDDYIDFIGPPTRYLEHATVINHESALDQKPFLCRQGWKVEDLLCFLDSQGYMPREQLMAMEGIPEAINTLTQEIGGPDETFDVAWWCSLVLASKR